MKSLLKKFAKRGGYVFGIAVAAIVVGISLQFAKAWTAPDQSAPNGTVGAPINTGGNDQSKSGRLFIGDGTKDYVPSGADWNYTMRLDSKDTTSIGFHDAYDKVGSIRFKNNLFTIGADDGWGIADTNFDGFVTIAAKNGNGSVKIGEWISDNNYASISLNGSTASGDYNILSSPLDTNLFINRPLTKDINFRMGNVDQMILKSSGNVMIGTTSPQTDPQARLHITAEDGTTNAFRISNVSNPSNYYLNMKPVVTSGVQRWVFDQTNNGTNYPNVLAFDRGNVGIGTSDPQAKLDIKGDVLIGDPAMVQQYDVSGDGSISTSDSVLILQVVVGLKTCPVGFNCDVNNSGSVNIGDAVVVMNAVAGAFDSNLEVGGSISARSVKFADGSIQTTALEGSVPASLCLPPKVAGGVCEDNFYLKGPSTCCPFNSTVAAIAGAWVPIDQVAISYAQNDPDGNWATTQDKSFVSPKTVAAVRVSGYSNDGGYCYAYWGTGHKETVRHDSYAGYYNVDGSYHAGVTSGGYDSNGDPLPDVSDPCPTYPATFDSNGVAKICQINWSAGAMPTVTQAGLSIPTGTTFHLQGRHTIGDKSDAIECRLDVQYVN